MDGSLKLATIRDDTWNVLNMQHITPNSKRWDYSDIPGGSHVQIKGPAHMVEGGHHPRNRPPTLGTMSVDFYHYPVTVWAYSTPQPNTEVPAPTGGQGNSSMFCTSFHSHLWIQTEVTIWKHSIRFKIVHSCAVWPWNLADDIEKQQGTSFMPLQALCMIL